MLFLPIKFKTVIQLRPDELDGKYQERMMEKLRSEYEGICSKYGYIKQNSIEIIKRSCGMIQKAFFNGCISFEVLCRAEVCNPVQGSIVEATVKNKNQLGVLAESYMESESQPIPILDIIIPIKSAGIISQIPLEHVQIGDVIHVEVMGKKFQMKDKKISIIGRGVLPNEKKEKEIITEEEEEEIQKPEDEEILLPMEDKKGGAEEEEEEEEESDEESDDEEDYEEEEDYEDYDGEEDIGNLDEYED
jgi:DNA-directed RNA polymerase subunit E'/Rpb7